jgi:hypothetical protein
MKEIFRLSACPSFLGKPNENRGYSRQRQKLAAVNGFLFEIIIPVVLETVTVT